MEARRNGQSGIRQRQPSLRSERLGFTVRFDVCVTGGSMSYLRSLIALITALLRRSDRAELGLIAAGVAFFGFLAIFPTVSVIIAVWGFVADPAVIQQDLALLKGFLQPRRLCCCPNKLMAFCRQTIASLVGPRSFRPALQYGLRVQARRRLFRG